MRNPYVVIHTSPPMTVCYPSDDSSGISYYVLTGIGTIHQPITGQEAANCTITLDCDGEIEHLLFNLPPLRTLVEIFSPTSTLLFSGLISAIAFTDTITLTLES